MDILYILGSGSKHNNEELRYSLRSLEYCCGGSLGRVYLVGECPDWLNKEQVTYIPFKDRYNRKCKNIWAKILYAIDHSDLPNEFLLSSDDIFHIKEQDLDNYPYYHKNGLYVGVANYLRGTNIWYILEETKALLRRYNYPMEDYGGGHCLHHVNVSILKNMPKITADVFNGTYGAPFDVIMGNAIVKLLKPKTIVRKDIKLESVKNEADFYKQIGDSESFSIDDKAWDDFVGEWLKQKYPKKSRFEL